jgi:hypothetical protein
MNGRKHFTIGLALIGLALGLTAARANAQTALKGTFDLPAAAYWGDTLLQPGEYTVSMSTQAQASAQVPVIHISGEGINATFLAVATPGKESGRNYLDVANIDGTYVIRALDAGSIGETFAFSVTKNVKNKALRASVEPAIAIPVSE